MKPLLPVALAPQWWRRAAGLPLVAVVALAAPGAGPAVAQSAEDWSTAPLTLPADPGGAPARAPDASVPPPRQILQPPPELRRPQAPLQPGEAPPSAPRPLPSVRVIPGTGVRPTPARAPATVAPVPASRVPSLPARSAPAPSARPGPVSPTSPLSPGPSAADLERIRASLRQSRLATPKPAVPNYLESLPPGTLRPLPGEVLPGSRPPGASPGRSPLPSGAGPSPLQGMPPPPLPPQAVPPPPWLGGKKEPPRRDSPWAWLLLGLGLGGTGVFLLQERRRPMAGAGPLDALGIRVVPRPDPGTQTLRPLESAGASQGE